MNVNSGPKVQNEQQGRVSPCPHAPPQVQPQNELVQNEKAPHGRHDPLCAAEQQRAQPVREYDKNGLQLRYLPLVRDQSVPPQHALYHRIVKALVRDADAVSERERDQPEYGEKGADGCEILSENGVAKAGT